MLFHSDYFTANLPVIKSKVGNICYLNKQYLTPYWFAN